MQPFCFLLRVNKNVYFFFFFFTSFVYTAKRYWFFENVRTFGRVVNISDSYSVTN